MLHGHASTSKTLVQAFFAAKTAPNRSRIAAAAAASPAPESLTSGVAHGTAETDTNVAADAPSGGNPSPEGGGGSSGGNAAVSSPAGLAAPKGRKTSERALLEGTKVAAAGNDGLLPGGAAGGVEAGGGKGHPKVGGGGGSGGGKQAVVILKSDGSGFVEDGGGHGSASTLADGREPRDDGQSSGGEAGDGAISEATNSSLGVTEAVLVRRASEAGVAVSGAGTGGYSFACLGDLTVDHTSLLKWSTVSTPRHLQHVGVHCVIRGRGGVVACRSL